MTYYSNPAAYLYCAGLALLLIVYVPCFLCCYFAAAACGRSRPAFCCLYPCTGSADCGRNRASCTAVEQSSCDSSGYLALVSFSLFLLNQWWFSGMGAEKDLHFIGGSDFMIIACTCVVPVTAAFYVLWAFGATPSRLCMDSNGYLALASFFLFISLGIMLLGTYKNDLPVETGLGTLTLGILFFLLEILVFPVMAASLLWAYLAALQSLLRQQEPLTPCMGRVAWVPVVLLLPILPLALSTSALVFDAWLSSILILFCIAGAPAALVLCRRRGAPTAYEHVAAAQAPPENV